MSPEIRVLVVDDEAYVRDSLCEVLQGDGLATRGAASVEEGARALEQEAFDVVVTDLRMPSGDGIALVDEARREGVPVPVIVITGVGTVAEAVAVMKAGAFDLMQKPVDPDELLLLVRRAAEHRALLEEVRQLRDTVDGLREARRLVGSAPVMQRLRAQVEQVARTDATVLLVGESGTGKELVAEELHRLGPRASRPFVRVNCGAIPAEHFESELFGHKQGAFPGATADRRGRFEEAEGGTLVLDEVGTLEPQMQAKLLRVLDSREYQKVGDARTRIADVRVVAVTNEDLARKVEEGAFRPDLLYRLNVFPLVLPALREHLEDLPEIAEHLLERARRSRPGAAPGGLSREALEALVSYEWPGNVRELRNVIERAVIVAGDGPLHPPLLRGILESTLTPGGPPLGETELHLRRNLDAREKELLGKALARSGGRKKEAANLLGIDPRNLGYYLRKHGMQESSGG